MNTGGSKQFVAQRNFVHLRTGGAYQLRIPCSAPRSCLNWLCTSRLDTFAANERFVKNIQYTSYVNVSGLQSRSALYENKKYMQMNKLQIAKKSLDQITTHEQHKDERSRKY